MDDFQRQMSAADREDVRKISESLKTSTYLTDEWWESIHRGAVPARPKVPNYKQMTKGEILAHAQNPEMSIASESSGFNMDFGGLYDGSEINEEVAESSSRSQSRPSKRLTVAQATAVTKFPALVEFLGTTEGENIARRLMSEINSIIAKIVNANSKECNDHAIECQADKQNLKQYFKGADWLCRVTVSGPFRGDEAIYYSREKDVAGVLRKQASQGSVRYTDVSEQFNIIFEAENIPEVSIEENTDE